MLTTTLSAIERGTEVKVLAGDGVEPGYECKGRTFSIYNGVKKEGNADCVVCFNLQVRDEEAS